jgi:hypothetical protein
MHTSSSKNTILLVLCFLVATAAVNAQTGAQSRLLPDTEYKFTLKKSIGGSNSMKELIPSASTQAMKIETGAETGAGIPATLTVGRPEQSGRQSVNRPPQDWKFSFVAGKDGQLNDIKVLVFEGEVPQDVGEKILLRYLSDLLFLSIYKTDPETKITVLSQKPAQNGQIQLTYSIEDEQTNPTVRNEEREPIATTKNGTAVYDASRKFFISRELHEINKIFVPEDPSEKAKNIVMKIDQVITVEIKSK